jgi:indole-3-glycerol phosphate synthase
MDFLASMAQSSAARVAAARAQLPDNQLLARALASPLPPRLQLSPQRFDLIAEVKLRSPAVGQLTDGAEDVAGRVGDYASAGAAAVSVLTEPTRFDGSLDHLRLATQALAGRAPTMRKDFLVDPYQVMEARMAGAGGVLVILRMVPVEVTGALLDMSARLGLFVLLEAFDEADIALAGQLLRSHAAAANAARAPLLVGVNRRDLVTLHAGKTGVGARCPPVRRAWPKAASMEPPMPHALRPLATTWHWWVAP